MPTLSKHQVGIIVTALNNQHRPPKATSTWITLVKEFGLGEVRDRHVYFSRQDYKAWREILKADCGYDPTQTVLTGDRTAVSRITPNEKWSTESMWARRVSVTVIGGDLVTTGGRAKIIPGVDYGVDYTTLRPADYDALLVIENSEAFFYAHQFDLPDLGHILVLYRGHDRSARSVMMFLENVRSIPIIGFTDPDPAGAGLLCDSKVFNHALIPDVSYLEDTSSLANRFGAQLAARPNLREQCSGRSDAFQQYVKWILDSGFAGTQEWLCSHSVPLRLIPL